MEKFKKWLLIAIRLGLGILFIYAGVQKFRPKESTPSSSGDVPAHVVKIRSLIGGMKQTDYFWEMVGVAEITCGLMLVSQFLGTLGAVMLVPLTLNIFLFHFFLIPNDPGEVVMSAVYLIANISLLALELPKLKQAFYPQHKLFNV